MPDVTLRVVADADLPVLFEHQCDVEAARLAAFPSRGRDAFRAHWTKLLANPECVARAVVSDGVVVGHIGAWSDDATGDRLVGYWIGREAWGRGIASAALRQFLAVETARPLVARVAKHNPASIRVLQKNGFVIVGQDRFDGSDGGQVEEFILSLR